MLESAGSDCLGSSPVGLPPPCGTRNQDGTKSIRSKKLLVARCIATSSKAPIPYLFLYASLSFTFSPHLVYLKSAYDPALWVVLADA